jgi:site-specific recombinase XerD
MARRDDAPKFHGLLSLFLNEHLPVRRKSSDKTIRSYRQSIKQFAAWNRERRGVRFDHMGFGDLSRDVVYDFLVWLRDERGLSPQTLNLRLSAIKAFLRFCGEEDVELAGLYLSVSSIRPFKGSKSPGIEFLEPEQLKELFAEPDASTKLGRRDRFLMILAYESGARMQELIDLTCGCVQERGGYITLRVHGKGDKVRIVPLASQAVEHLDAYLSEFHPHPAPEDWLFFTVHGGMHTKMSPGTVDHLLKKYASAIHGRDPLLPRELARPHAQAQRRHGYVPRRLADSVHPGLPRTCGSEHDHGLRACRRQRDSECGRGRQPENRRPYRHCREALEG